MEKYFEIIKKIKLFDGIEENNLKAMLGCLNAEIKKLDKGKIVLLAGEKPKNVGLVLDGELHITKEDINGNRTIIASVTRGEIFGEALCCAEVAESPVTVIADKNAVVMLISFNRILNICSNSCSHHTQLIRNMLKLVAQKNLFLQKRMEIVGIKSIRAKMLNYLKTFKAKKGNSITIPFNREELADFFCVERSALSHELARMKEERLIEYKKNVFRLL